MHVPPFPFPAVVPATPGLVLPREPAPTTTATTTSGTHTSHSSTSTGTSTTSSNTAPLFPEPTSSPNKDNGRDFAKPLLEYVLLGVGVFLILSLILKRVMRFRQSNHPLTFTSFLTASPARPPTSSNPLARRPTYPRTHALHEVPPYPSYDNYPAAAYPAYPVESHGRYPRYHTRALDIGAGGRRLGGGEDLTDKDVLPAYDLAGGPPKYVEMYGGAGPGPGAPGTAANLDANVPVVNEPRLEERIEQTQPQRQSREAEAPPTEPEPQRTREDRQSSDTPRRNVEPTARPA